MNENTTIAPGWARIETDHTAATEMHKIHRGKVITYHTHFLTWYYGTQYRTACGYDTLNSVTECMEINLN